MSINVSSNIKTGALSSIGATALQIQSIITAGATGVYIKASYTNTWILYIGNSTVTANSADATDGFELLASEGLFIEINDPSKLYVVGSTTWLKLFYTITY